MPVGTSRRCRDPAAWRLGRPLEPWETAHYQGGNHGDDHPDNLRVLPGPRAHALLHPYERREAKGVQHLWPLGEWLEPSGPHAKLETVGTHLTGSESLPEVEGRVHNDPEVAAMVD